MVNVRYLQNLDEGHAQISRQMCLEAHFQHEFLILGCFGLFCVVGAAEKKNPNCHKYVTFEASVSYFFMVKINEKIDFLYILVFALKSYIIQR